VRGLYKRLRADGFDPWLDEENLLPGQDWQREITAAVRKSDIVLVCLSRDSINKKGFVQKELRYALDVADEQPEGSIFIIPLKLEECDVPERLSHLQWVNFFENRGYEKLLASLRAKSIKPAVDARDDEPPAQATSESGRPREVTNESGQPRGEVLRDLFKGLLIIAFMLAVKIAVERTTFGEHLNLAIYNFLHLPPTAERIPVAVVDISDLGAEDFKVDGQSGRATPREPLRQMIEAISEHHPVAVGVAIDFSPDENGYIHPRDPEFFQFCLDIRRQRGVPVFLGINRTAAAPPEAWLGDEKYQDLAANLLIPRDSRRMLSEIQLGGEREAGRFAEAYKPGRAMSVALADSYGQESRASAGWFQHVVDGLRDVGLIEKISEKQLGPGLKVTDFLVDFSQLESIRAETIRTINPAELRDEGQRFKGKVVLIGSGTLGKATDLFVVPERNQPYPGIFLHACAAYTLIRAPLFEVMRKGRLGIDVVFSLAVLSVVILIRLYYRNRAAAEVAPHRLQGLFTLLTVSATLVVGVVFVREARLMWDDFLVAPAVLVFHPALERRLETFWEQLRGHALALSRRLTFKKNGEP
jgi:CHASE2 domain-containing sensor protein